MKKEFGIKLKYQREKAADEFSDLFIKARAAGKSDEHFIKELGEAKVRIYIAVFERIIEMSKKFNEKASNEEC